MSKPEFIKFMKFILRAYHWLFKNKYLIVLLVIFVFELFTRAYQMDLKNPFGYDQVDNAWAAKNIIVNHWYPLVGMVAKANSGVYIGPAYYYLISIFYWIYNLNPIASQAIAVVSSIFTFFVIFYVVKKLFTVEVALIALLINTFNYHIIIFDRIQWPVQLLPTVSLIIFYLLYRVILGDVKKLLPLAIFVGIAFNLHFTAVFFPFIIILSLPLFPRTRQTLKYAILSVPLFLVWIIPNAIYMLTDKFAGSTASSYFSTNFHGFHLKRMEQLVGDALIQFNYYLVEDKYVVLKFILLPLFFVVSLFKSFTSENKKFAYLIFVWFMVPWIVLTTYSGEISDYYFAINRFIVLMILAYLIFTIWHLRFLLVKLIVIVFLSLYCVYNFMVFLSYRDYGSVHKKMEIAQEAINQGRRIEFQIGVPESYTYYYLMKQKGIDVYEAKDK